MNPTMLDVLGWLWAITLCFVVSAMHFQTYHDPERNGVTRYLYRLHERKVQIQTFGWRAFERPESAIRFQAWASLLLGLVFLAAGASHFL